MPRLDGFFMIGLPKELEKSSVVHEVGGYHVTTEPAPIAVFISAVDDIPAEHVGNTELLDVFTSVNVLIKEGPIGGCGLIFQIGH